MVRMYIRKDVNRGFTAGEEAILEQACIILDRRGKDFISNHFRQNKILTLNKNEP
jgi:hypothetical protein